MTVQSPSIALNSHSVDTKDFYSCTTMNLMDIALKQRIGYFFIFASAAAVLFNPLKSLSNLSPEYFTLNGVYPWAVLFLCVIFLFAKRREIRDAKPAPWFAAGGAGIVIASFFLPAVALEFEIFRLLLAWVGLAFVFFGEAASLPALLLCIYGFGIAFPKLVNTFAGVQYAQATTWMVYTIAKNFITITTSGTAISMTTLSSERLIVIINAECSGAASISVFLAVFALMSLDIPLPRKQWAAMLLFGIIGTSIQNLLRIVLLLFAGYYFGPSAVEGGESFAGYIIFPLWYAFFALVYLKFARRNRMRTGQKMANSFF